MVTAKQGMITSGLTALILSSAYVNPSCTRTILNNNPVAYSSPASYNLTYSLDNFLTNGSGAYIGYLAGIAFVGFAVGGLVKIISNNKKKD